MASLMENLIDVLSQESEEYEGLLALSQKKMRIIASANLEDLQRITDDEQEVVSRLNRLEKRRIEVAADIANVLNKDVETMKLTNLIQMLSARPAEQAELAAVHDRLSSVVREVQRTALLSSRFYSLCGHFRFRRVSLSWFGHVSRFRHRTYCVSRFFPWVQATISVPKK